MATPVQLPKSERTGRVGFEAPGPETAGQWFTLPVSAGADFEPVSNVIAK